ncbi:hypothetical protein [Pseudomonas sp. PLMAX]|jgi:hypothetical protein|uniref:hypothetical protein n=1 Tax=Pseudomonas sp. PLMAX TaxID=2201998 RepID=UPI0038B9C8A8
MKFDISNFKKPNSVEEPDQSKNSIVFEKLRARISERYQEVSSSIQCKSNITFHERLISARQIALSCNISPSTLTPRRQPELVALIVELNNKLELLWQSESAKKGHSGRKKSKPQLLVENAFLKSEIERLTNLQLSSALSTAIENLLTEEARLQAYTIRQLKAEISRLNKVIDNQADMHQRMLFSASKP